MKTKLSTVAVLLAVAQLLVAFGIAMASDAEGWLGGLLFAAMYAAPLLLLARALRSSSRMWHAVARWSALALAVLYTAVVAVNWIGYTTAQAVAAVVLTAPAVVLDVVIFWTSRPQAPAARGLRPAPR